MTIVLSAEQVFVMLKKTDHHDLLQLPLEKWEWLKKSVDVLVGSKEGARTQFRGPSC